MLEISHNTRSGDFDGALLLTGLRELNMNEEFASFTGRRPNKVELLIIGKD